MNDIKECVHYWVLSSPNGKYSDGICTKCKMEKKDFVNTPDGIRFETGFGKYDVNQKLVGLYS